MEGQGQPGTAGLGFVTQLSGLLAFTKEVRGQVYRTVMEGSLLAEGELRLYVSLRGQPVRIPPMGKTRFARPGGSGMVQLTKALGSAFFSCACLVNERRGASSGCHRHAVAN
jgi:hypothetical protein